MVRWQWWEENFARLELLVAVGVSIAFAVWGELFNGRALVVAELRDVRATLYTALTSVYAALLGFNVATMAVVVTLCTSAKLTKLRRSPQYKTVWDVFKRGHRALAVGLVVAVAGLLFDREAHPSPLVVYACVAAAAWSTVRFARCVWVLELCAEKVGEPESASG
jgi:hypothetical protein